VATDEESQHFLDSINAEILRFAQDDKRRAQDDKRRAQDDNAQSFFNKLPMPQTSKPEVCLTSVF